MAKSLFYLTTAEALKAIKGSRMIQASKGGAYGKDPFVLLTQLESDEVPKKKVQVEKKPGQQGTSKVLGGYVKFELNDALKKTLEQVDEMIVDKGLVYGRTVFKHKGDLKFDAIKCKIETVELK